MIENKDSGVTFLMNNGFTDSEIASLCVVKQICQSIDNPLLDGLNWRERSRMLFIKWMCEEGRLNENLPQRVTISPNY